MQQTLTKPDRIQADGSARKQTLLQAIEAVLRVAGPGQIRAVAYLRVSTEDQKKGYGITASGKRVVRHIAEKGWALVDVYADEGFSGSLEVRDRPDLKRLMRRAGETPRPFDMVVVSEGRGIGRTGRAFWKWVWDLEDLGIYVHVVKKNYDNSTPAGRSQMRKDADYAEDERELIRDRTQGGIQEKAEEGLYPGGTMPFGYRIAEQGKRGVSHYAVDETEAETLRRARTLFLASRSWQKVALTLNSEHRRTKNGKLWTAKNIYRRMLGDAVLKRQIIWRGKAADRDPEGNPVFGRSVVINLPEIFTDEETAELKAAIEAQPRPLRSDSRVYLLTGLMVSPCGRTYKGHHNRSAEVVYRCKGRRESYAGAGDTCSCPDLEATAIERQVWADVTALLTDVGRMRAMAQDWMNATAGERVDQSERIAGLDRQITELEDIIEVTTSVTVKRALRRGRSGAEAEEAAERAVKPLEDELVGLEKLKQEAVAYQREAADVTRRLRSLERVAGMARSNFAKIGDHEKVELLTAMGLQAEVVRCASRRQGLACPVRAWFVRAGRGVPVLTDEGWELIRPLMGGSRSKVDRRQMVQAVLDKAVSGDSLKEVARRHSMPASSLQTASYRWLRSGVWAQAMDALAAAATRPVWSPDPIEIKVSLRPLAIESKIGDVKRDRWEEGRGAFFELTLVTAV